MGCFHNEECMRMKEKILFSMGLVCLFLSGYLAMDYIRTQIFEYPGIDSVFVALFVPLMYFGAKLVIEHGYNMWK